MEFCINSPGLIERFQLDWGGEFRDLNDAVIQPKAPDVAAVDLFVIVVLDLHDLLAGRKQLDAMLAGRGIAIDPGDNRTDHRDYADIEQRGDGDKWEADPDAERWRHRDL